jgi:putative ABC transport system permease protein
MFAYYLDLARRSLRRNAALTALMIIAIAFGVGASMTTLTVLHVLSVDPIPGKSQQLYYVQLDPQRALGYIPGEEPMEQLTRLDSEALLRVAKADRQVMMTSGQAAVEPQRAGLAPFFVDGRWTSADFFPMFRVLLLAGAAWSAEDDARAARVAVITRALADKLYGTTEAVGRTIRVQGSDLRVIGVAENWRPAPHFYDLNTDIYGAGEQLFVPFSTSRDIKLARSGSLDCWTIHRAIRWRPARPACGPSSGSSSAARTRPSRTATSWSATRSSRCGPGGSSAHPTSGCAP